VSHAGRNELRLRGAQVPHDGRHEHPLVEHQPAEVGVLGGADRTAVAGEVGDRMAFHAFLDGVRGGSGIDEHSGAG
jgi:hypothetical protein